MSCAGNGGTHLERFLPCVNELMPLQLGTLHKSLAALGADVHTGPVGVQMLPHRRVIPEHLGASLIWIETRQSASLGRPYFQNQMISTFKVFDTSRQKNDRPVHLLCVDRLSSWEHHLLSLSLASFYRHISNRTFVVQHSQPKPLKMTKI